jgi:putative transposase
MEKTEHLNYGQYYHIYNRGIDGCNLFTETTNYEYFLQLYDKHIQPIAETYAFVLMKNHFHLLVRIKDPSCLPGFRNPPSDLPGFENLEGLEKLEGLENPRTLEGLLKPPHQHFSNLFNAYTKAFNKKYGRTGSLFEKNFHRKSIQSESYLKSVLLYIHNNPVHHGFCQRPSDYPWSSYLSCISIKSTRLMRKVVIGWFDDLGNFIYCHEKKVETEQIEEWLKI